MSAWHYDALDQKGKSKKGILEADSERQARQLLREQGLIPLAVSPTKKVLSTQKNRFSADTLCLFTRQLATLLPALPVEESLEGVAEQTENHKVRTVVMGVRSKVLEGHSLAEAMNEFPKAFPELYRATVAAGEQTGRLDTVLSKLADYTEQEQKTRQKVQQALIYPILMLTVSFAIIGFLLSFVVPKIIEVFSESHQVLPPMTRALISISHFLKSNGFYLFVMILMGVVVFLRVLKNPVAKYRIHRFLLKIPILSWLIKSTDLARYIHTFSILFSSGVSVLETMRVSANLVSNLYMREAFQKATDKVREGTAITRALKETHFLDPMSIHLIGSGEKSGQIANMMDRSATHLDNEVRRVIDTALTLLEPIIILAMGGIVLFIVLATLLPIFSMEQLVG